MTLQASLRDHLFILLTKPAKAGVTTYYKLRPASLQQEHAYKIKSCMSIKKSFIFLMRAKQNFTAKMASKTQTVFQKQNLK